MTTVSETLPTLWSAEDERFFRIVRNVFSPGFLAGAGVLLASYDAEPAGITSVAVASRTSPSADAAVCTPTFQSGSGLCAYDQNPRS